MFRQEIYPPNEGEEDKFQRFLHEARVRDKLKAAAKARAKIESKPNLSSTYYFDMPRYSIQAPVDLWINAVNDLAIKSILDYDHACTPFMRMLDRDRDLDESIERLSKKAIFGY